MLGNLAERVQHKILEGDGGKLGNYAVLITTALHHYNSTTFLTRPTNNVIVQ